MHAVSLELTLDWFYEMGVGNGVSGVYHRGRSLRRNYPVTTWFDKTPRKTTVKPWYTDFGTIFAY